MVFSVAAGFRIELQGFVRMPHDFGSQDRSSGPGFGSGIGFHELRQACEISTLREDLERLTHEAGGLRDSVEEAVEDIRDRFAALTAEQMTDAAMMAPLLQVAVTTLLDIRERTRRLNTLTGPVADDDRSSWLGAADAPRVRPANLTAAPCSPAAQPSSSAVVPSPTLPALQKSQPVPPAPSSSREVAEPPVPVDPPSGSPAASWLTAKAASAPPLSRAASARNATSAPATPGGIDWLGPAGR